MTFISTHRLGLLGSIEQKVMDYRRPGQVLSAI